MMENVLNIIKDEDAVPDPEYLIKSIAEQGYTLETSLSDLVDNSITANATKIEILVDLENAPFTLFLADDGIGMNEKELISNMKFPSSSPAKKRDKLDLGRFGLGMKTASFAQSRKFTVLSRKKGSKIFHGRTWDVEYLTKLKSWKIIINSTSEIENIIAKYKYLNKSFLNTFENFNANTIIIWEGLYKYDQIISLENRKKAIQHDISEITSEYLSIVFHRFLSNKSPLHIRLNNQVLKPFNPFPTDQLDFRPLKSNHKIIRNESLSMNGYILPSRSMKETKDGTSIWTTNSKSLMDMEGIYVYRANRLISFGGWNGIIKKTPKLQLARLMVNLGNGIDDIIHLNVSKSRITIPYESKLAFLKYLAELKNEAEKEYINRTFTNSAKKYNSGNSTQVFLKIPTNKGSVLTINQNFPIIVKLRNSLNKPENMHLSVLLRVFRNTINKMRFGDDYNDSNIIVEEDANSEIENLYAIRSLLTSGMTVEDIKKHFLPLIGYETESLPISIKNIIDA